MDDKEYKKFLGKLFPSKFINKRIKEYEEADKIMDEEERKNKKLRSPTKDKMKNKNKEKMKEQINEKKDKETQGNY